MTLSPPFIVSSPGKVIIFGEHAAVFGKVSILVKYYDLFSKLTQLCDSPL